MLRDKNKNRMNNKVSSIRKTFNLENETDNTFISLLEINKIIYRLLVTTNTILEAIYHELDTLQQSVESTEQSAA